MSGKEITEELVEDPKQEETVGTSAEEDGKLLESVQSRLDKLRDGPDPDSGKPAEESEDDSESTPEDDKADDDEAEDDTTPDEEEKEEGKEIEDEKKEAGDSPTLPASYYRAAIHQGWKPEEIESFFKERPEQAIQTFEKIYETTNNLSKEWANWGRRKHQDDEKKEEKPSSKPEFKGVDIEKLRKDYDGDPIVDMIAAMQDQNKALFDAVQGMTQAKPADKVGEKASRTVAQEDAALQQQIDQFFTDPEMKPYTDFYGEGKDWEKLDKGQQLQRWAVLEMADNMMDGTQIHGKEMSVSEALTLAHLSISEPVREKAIRTELTSKLQKRAKGLSLKPTSKKRVKEEKPNSPQELEAKVARNLQKVFS